MRHVLTIPDQQTAESAVAKCGGSSGQGELIKALAQHPLALTERGRPQRMDHVHLSRFDGTDYCQWYGRCADGWHRPIGRIMEIVAVHDDYAAVVAERDRAQLCLRADSTTDR